MRLEKTLTSLLFPLMAFLCAFQPLSGIEVEERAPIGTRALPREERRALQQQCLMMSQKEGNKEALEEKTLPSSEMNAKAYVTTHDGVFHSPYKSGFVIIFADGCVEWIGDPVYSLNDLSRLYPGSIFISWAVQLEDGSIWEVPYSDRYRTLDWFASDSLIVVPNDSWFSSYDYKLVNRNTGIELKSNLVLGPFVNGYYTHWIMSISYETREVVLEDNSIWRVCGWYQDILNRWMPGDVLIMGINNSPFSMTLYPNILINVDDNAYVNCRCIY